MSGSDEDFASMLAEFEGGRSKARRPKVGDIVSGKIISIGKDAVFVDLGGKAEGMLERNQVTDDEDRLKVAVGDTIEARIASDAGGVYQLRIKIQRGPEAKAELVSAQELGIPVEGVVTEVIKGGVSVDVAGVRGFCPASQVDARFVEDLAPFVGQRLQFKVTRYEPSPRGGNLVLSRRALVEEENARKAEALKGKLVPGAVLRGKVVGMKPFGAFVDLGGIEGMLHVSELGFSRVASPEEMLTIGQELDVAVLKIEPDPKGKGDRISLSLKALGTDPWRDSVAHLGEGAQVKGTITRLQPFGAFVEIAPGVEGLVHISELGAGRRINHPKEVVSIGQAVEATVLAVDLDKRRLSLSLGKNEGGSAADVSEVVRAQPAARFGTFADLLNKKK